MLGGVPGQAVPAQPPAPRTGGAAPAERTQLGRRGDLGRQETIRSREPPTGRKVVTLHAEGGPSVMLPGGRPPLPCSPLFLLNNESADKMGKETDRNRRLGTMVIPERQ